MFVNEESGRLRSEYAGQGSAPETVAKSMPATAKTDMHEIDYARPMKVIVIGAGISGILAAIRFPRRIPRLELVVYDKNPEVGGTWYENRYPGVACDIPAHVYQASFEPNPNWSQFYASGQEILAYWKGIVVKYGVDKYLQLGHRVVEARFNDATSQWHVKVQNCASREVVDDTCDVLYGCMGSLNDWHWPDIPGLQSFQGKLLHSAAWDDAWDPSGQTVAVIGSGSSAIQIVPSLQPRVKHLENYVRGKVWIAPPVAEAEVRKRTKTASNFQFTEAELQAFRETPSTLLAYRKMLDSEIQSMTKVTLRGALSDEAAAQFTASMEAKLAKKPEILDALLPSFAPGCRRITPGPGYLEALTEDNVTFVHDSIRRVTPDGIVTASDGALHRVDAIICATGFDTSFTGRFPIVGARGIHLDAKWEDYPDTYIGLCTPGMPNYFVAHGPNAGLGIGSVSIVLERTCDYVCAAVAKMQRDRIATLQPKRAPTDAFVAFCRDYFSRTVFSLPCRSWYKRGTSDGPVTALWPGSALHFVKTLETPRWEDYEYTYLDGSSTSVAWLGNGFTLCENDKAADKSAYLDPENIDYPTPGVVA
ncbi:hypothetical protein SCUCBS95973_005427 [Sporothrix curviconia]|uniref:Cyclohexanone monooxygenase n=1 Tax=Sporothrix curviconia TaxID=1260050 RepID=A0ABP0BYY2_9PEZI